MYVDLEIEALIVVWFYDTYDGLIVRETRSKNNNKAEKKENGLTLYESRVVFPENTRLLRKRCLT